MEHTLSNDNKKLAIMATVSFTAVILGNYVAHHLRNGNKHLAIPLALGGIVATYFVLKHDSTSK